MKNKKRKAFPSVFWLTLIIFSVALYLLKKNYISDEGRLNQSTKEVSTSLTDEPKLTEQLNDMSLTQFHAEVIDKFCIDCHDSVSEEGGVNLEGLSLNISKDIQTAEIWDHVLKAVNSGEMPPKKKKQLPKDIKLNFLQELSQKMVVARRALSDSSGEVTLRRLNRREYINSLVNLLGIEPRKDTYLLLPKDEDLDGFDTNGRNLYFSSHQFELYRKIAKETLADLLQLYGTKKPKSKVTRVELEIETMKDVKKELSAYQLQYDKAVAYLKGEEDAPKLLDKMKAKKNIHTYTHFAPHLIDYVSREENETGATMLVYKFHDREAKSHTFKPRTGGKYKIRYKLATINNPKDGYVYAQTPTGYKKITGTLKSPQLLSMEKTLRPSNEKTYFGLKIRNTLSRPQRWNYFISEVKKNGIGPAPHLWVDWVEVEGPIHENWPPYNLPEILLETNSGEDHYSYVNRLLTSFATNAFRGKAPDSRYISKLVDIYKSFGGSKKKFKEAIVEPLSIILASPSFLYISEPTKEQKTIADHELAVRLAYFLWSSPPDQELLSLAKSEKLSNQKILAAQTERLLNHPNSDQFIRGFTYQWLGMRDVDTFQFDAKDFPEFDEDIRRLAKEEIYKSVEHILTKNKSLDELLVSNFVVVNDRLADYYKIPGVQGEEFRPVKLSKDSPRGGLLGMAALHILGSDGKESNLVKRGAWVMTHILNDSPPPPPADVPQLSRFEGEGPVNARILHKKHQEEPQCAQCHVSIDPIGYGLENFNAAGVWREDELHHISTSKTSRKKKKINKTVSLKIDPSGKLPSGENFNSFHELRSNLAKHKDKFTRGFIEALISYGLARDYSFVDEQFANDLEKIAQKNGNTIRSYIHHLVQSKAFKYK
ncbi:MAG: DUF1592 domain-containing protein [Lentisphaeraceae bacterium]|nr:DUF1592 domain-containing protein [Lentisphaeraceae bacterium]